MDPLTQGVLGATAALCAAPKDKQRPALLAGTLGGILADVDVLIRSAQDPLLELEFHRHFTHSLFFIPLGGLVTALLIWLFIKKQVSFKQAYFFSTLGYATHGLLDACTSYGTQLLWPLNSLRISWNIISIIDPAYTLPLLGAVILTLWTQKATWIRLGFAFSLFYLFLGFVQKERALDFQAQLASQRGHTINRGVVHPTLGNLLLWRSTYEAEGVYYVDALRMGILLPPKNYQGPTVPVFSIHQEWPTLSSASILFQDILRFSWFSDGWIYRVPGNPTLLSDLRYSILPHTITPLWALEILDHTPQTKPKLLMLQRVAQRDWSHYWLMLQGAPLPQ